MMDTEDDGSWSPQQWENESLYSILLKVKLEDFADKLKDDGGITCVEDLLRAKPEHLSQIFKNELIFLKVWNGIKELCGAGYCNKTREVKFASLDNFLTRVGVREYAHDLHCECIQLDDLAHLGRFDIEKLITEVGPRGRIVRAIDILRTETRRSEASDEDWDKNSQAETAQTDDWSVPAAGYSGTQSRPAAQYAESSKTKTSKVAKVKANVQQLDDWGDWNSSAQKSGQGDSEEDWGGTAPRASGKFDEKEEESDEMDIMDCSRDQTQEFEIDKDDWDAGPSQTIAQGKKTSSGDTWSSDESTAWSEGSERNRCADHNLGANDKNDAKEPTRGPSEATEDKQNDLNEDSSEEGMCCGCDNFNYRNAINKVQELDDWDFAAEGADPGNDDDPTDGIWFDSFIWDYKNRDNKFQVLDDMDFTLFAFEYDNRDEPSDSD